MEAVKIVFQSTVFNHALGNFDIITLDSLSVIVNETHPEMFIVVFNTTEPVD